MTELPPRAQRRRVLKGARIVFKGGHSTIDCMVRNLSDSGALLRVEGALSLPDEFDLLLEENDRRPCRVAWRKLDGVGVAFVTE